MNISCILSRIDCIKTKYDKCIEDTPVIDNFIKINQIAAEKFWNWENQDISTIAEYRFFTEFEFYKLEYLKDKVENNQELLEIIEQIIDYATVITYIQNTTEELSVKIRERITPENSNEYSDYMTNIEYLQLLEILELELQTSSYLYMIKSLYNFFKMQMRRYDIKNCNISEYIPWLDPDFFCWSFKDLVMFAAQVIPLPKEYDNYFQVKEEKIINNNYYML